MTNKNNDGKPSKNVYIPDPGMTPARASKKVSEILVSDPDADVSAYMELLNKAAKFVGSGNRKKRSSLNDTKSNCLIIYCLYHKRFELVANHPQIGVDKGFLFGVKADTISGHQSYCKNGGIQGYESRLKAFNVGNAQLNIERASGKITMHDFLSKKQKLDADKIAIDPAFDNHKGKHFATLEEAAEWVENNIKGVDIAYNNEVSYE